MTKVSYLVQRFDDVSQHPYLNDFEQTGTLSILTQMTLKKLFWRDSLQSSHNTYKTEDRKESSLQMTRCTMCPTSGHNQYTEISSHGLTGVESYFRGEIAYEEERAFTVDLTVRYITRQ